jgi:ribosomal protein S19
MRSHWKSYYFLYNLLFANPNKSKIFFNRSMIPKNLIGLRLAVYNGRKLESFLVKDFGDLKFRFAEFVTTKKRGNIHSFIRSKKLTKK